MTSSSSSSSSSEPAREIAHWLRYIDAALAHPVLPCGRHAYEPPRAAPPPLRDLYHCLYKLYTEEPRAAGFREPVNALESGALDYYAAVERPASLRGVLDAIVEGRADAAAALAAVERIWQNCAAFNGPTSALAADARACAAALDRLRRRLEDEKPAAKDAIDAFYERMQRQGTPEINKALLDYFEKHDPSVLVDGEVLLDSLTNKHLQAILRILDQFAPGDS